MSTKDEQNSDQRLIHDESGQAERREVRQSGCIKNPLFHWRRRANLKQERLADFFGVHPTTIGRYENADPAELRGLGDVIIAWAAICGVQPRSAEVQGLLLDSANAPYMTEPDCDDCHRELCQEAERIATEHLRKHVSVKYEGSRRDADAIARHIKHNSAAAQSHRQVHPYRRTLDRIRSLLPCDEATE